MNIALIMNDNSYEGIDTGPVLRLLNDELTNLLKTI